MKTVKKDITIWAVIMVITAISYLAIIAVDHHTIKAIIMGLYGGSMFVFGMRLQNNLKSKKGKQ